MLLLRSCVGVGDVGVGVGDVRALSKRFPVHTFAVSDVENTLISTSKKNLKNYQKNGKQCQKPVYRLV